MKNTKSMHPNVFNALHTSDQDELGDLYSAWATSYDHDVVEVIGYIGHIITTNLLLKYLTNTSSRILDAGCGTGLVGEILNKKKFIDIIGIDFSRSMLSKALIKGIYKYICLADLTHRIGFKDNTFDAIICAGTFTCGHVGPDALKEMVRVTRSGGYISFSVREQEWDSAPYIEAIRQLKKKNRWRCIEQFYTDYNTKENASCQLCLYQVL
jgi:predicted TPR repeat methyltransferase